MSKLRIFTAEEIAEGVEETNMVENNPSRPVTDAMICHNIKFVLESEYKALESAYNKLKEDHERLSKRDCNATIQLMYNDGKNPFASEELKIVDVGVSDNTYIVNSKLVEEYFKLKEEVEESPVGIIAENGGSIVVIKSLDKCLFTEGLKVTLLKTEDR